MAWQTPRRPAVRSTMPGKPTIPRTGATLLLLLIAMAGCLWVLAVGSGLIAGPGGGWAWIGAALVAPYIATGFGGFMALAGPAMRPLALVLTLIIGDQTMNDTERTKLVGLRIKLTPEEYGFAEFYGQELCNGSPRDYLRALLIKALSREMQRERETKARIKAEQELEANGLPPSERSWSLNLDDKIPF